MSNPDLIENGVEVYYSNNCEMYHVTNESTGEYDAKIDQHPGGMEYYSTNNDWASHDHYHTDNNGNTTECHGMESRDWDDKCRS